jgi:hypothetical protein
MIISNNSFKDYLEVSLYINVEVLQVMDDNEVKVFKKKDMLKNYKWI